MRSRIAFKLAAIWLVVALPLAGILGLTYMQWHEARLSLVEEQRLGYARLSASSFALLVQEMQKGLQISGEDLAERRASSIAVATELRRLARIYPADNALLANSEGRVIAASKSVLVGHDLSSHPAFLQALARGDGAGIEPSEKGSGDVVGFHVAKRIDGAEGQAPVVMLVFVDVRRLHEEFPVATRTGGISLVDNAGQVVFQNEDVELALQREGWGNSFSFVRDALNGATATTRDFDFPLGGQRIGVFVPIGYLGWAAGSSVDRQTALAPFYRGLWFGLPIALVLVVVGLATSNLIADRIRASLVKLSADAERIGNGQLDEPVYLRRTDEIGELASSLEEARLSLDSYVRENALLLDRQRQAAELNGTLADIDNVLHSTLDFRDILARVLERSATALDCDMAEVNLREDDHWVRVALYGHSQESLDERMTDEENPVSALIARTGEPVIIDAISADPRVTSGFAERYNVQASMAFPLIVQDAVVGVVFFNHITSSAPFTREQVDFAARLSYSLSLAYENARLYAAERDVAEILQTALLVLPERLEGLTFASAYRSATEAARVGGDFYDLFELDDGRIGCTIGDISGHGIDAAVLTSLVKNAIRVAAMESDCTPADVMATASQILLRNSLAETFATVFLGLVDVADDRIAYCSAGHPTAFCVDSEGLIARLASTSPVIGALETLEFTNAEARFAEGDELFLYTDGLTEARSGPELFGEQRLVDLLRKQPRCNPEITVESVVKAALDFANGRLSDDLAVLAVCRRGPTNSGGPRGV